MGSLPKKGKCTKWVGQTKIERDANWEGHREYIWWMCNENMYHLMKYQLFNENIHVWTFYSEK